jgi:hypothetical protein
MFFHVAPSNQRIKQNSISTPYSASASPPNNAELAKVGLELPEIMQAGIAQHGARFNEIRSRGFEVENELDRDNGTIRSRYVLKFDPEMEAR